jgi:hypothetical protein
VRGRSEFKLCFIPFQVSLLEYLKQVQVPSVVTSGHPQRRIPGRKHHEHQTKVSSNPPNFIRKKETSHPDVRCYQVSSHSLSWVSPAVSPASTVTTCPPLQCLPSVKIAASNPQYLSSSLSILYPSQECRSRMETSECSFGQSFPKILGYQAFFS